MPRTKVARNYAGSNKRKLDVEDLGEILRDFDIEVESSINMLQSEHNRQLREIDQQFENLKRSIPEHVLKMKIKDLACFRGFDEILVKEKMCDFNCTVKETVQKAGDEGYLTEGASNKSRFTSGSESGAVLDKSNYQNVSIIGSLHKIKTRRRSKSVSSTSTIITPGPRTMMSAAKARMTPMAQSTVQKQPVPHTSRSKYRTPMSAMRQKAMSADRINTITPKVNPNKPFSMLRHARAGEAVFSLTGSPIVASNIVEYTANVNIPIIDGILSIRPECMDATNLDPSIVHKIDQQTFNHLRTLKANLDILMSGFNRKFHH